MCVLSLIPGLLVFLPKSVLTWLLLLFPLVLLAVLNRKRDTPAPPYSWFFLRHSFGSHSLLCLHMNFRIAL